MSTDIYAVVYDESYTIPGDQRSRDYPGHGYPESTETNTIFKKFKSYAEFESWIMDETHKQYGKRSFKAYRCTPIEVTTEIKINIK